MKVLYNYNLIKHNTLGLNASAYRFIEYYNDNEIIEYIEKEPEIFKADFFIIGKGSNLLFSNDYSGTIIHPATENINIISQDEDCFYIEASAGVTFCNFIEWTINNKAFGLENLSNIPGTVGASAVQNIGAYGAEAAEYIDMVKYYDLVDNKIKTIKNIDCKFGYRNSIFKNELKNKTIILSVTFKLFKNFNPNLSYVDVKNYFENDSRKEITAMSIREAVISIRNQKLPDPDKVGNAGSFFKNPVITKSDFLVLQERFPDVKYYNHSDNMIKIAAGWLIDKCGLKGFEHGGAAVHDKQALVIINKNNATGKAILELSKIIQDKIYNYFGVNLEPEVIFI